MAVKIDKMIENMRDMWRILNKIINRINDILTNWHSYSIIYKYYYRCIGYLYSNIIF